MIPPPFSQRKALLARYARLGDFLTFWILKGTVGSRRKKVTG